MALHYLDSSALVKLAHHERESAALSRFVRAKSELVVSALARVEVARALAPHGPDAVARGRAVLDRVEIVRINDRVLAAAGALPGDLRSLDAIHIATARIVGGVRALVTYDARMATAARGFGIRVVAPK